MFNIFFSSPQFPIMYMMACDLTRYKLGSTKISFKIDPSGIIAVVRFVHHDVSDSGRIQLLYRYTTDFQYYLIDIQFTYIFDSLGKKPNTHRYNYYIHRLFIYDFFFFYIYFNIRHRPQDDYLKLKSINLAINRYCAQVFFHN